MQTIRTIRCKINIQETDLHIVNQLFDLYAQACTKIAQYGRENKESNKFKLQRALYKEIRAETNLTANLVITALGHTAGILKAAKCRGKFQFKPTFVALSERTFTLQLNKGTIEFPTIQPSKRIKASLDIGSYQHEALWGADTTQSATLIRAKDGFYCNIHVKHEVPDSTQPGVLGVDLGIRNIAVTSNGTKFDGKLIREFREKRWQIRASLQSNGTRGCKKVLSKLSGYEARRTSQLNHEIAKAIVSEAVASGCGVIVLENLSGIRDRLKIPNKHRNRMMSLWSFYQLQQFIAYKAGLVGIKTIKIDPAYTSQTCHLCNQLGQRNKEVFVCTPCGLKTDADINAAKVIAARGASVSKPESANPVLQTA